MPDDEIIEFIFSWKILNYLASYQFKGDYIDSPDFNLENVPGSFWYLRLYPKGVSTLEENGHVSLYLKWESYENNSLTPLMDFKMELVVGPDIVLSRTERQIMFQNIARDWGWHMFMNIDKLTEEMNIRKEDTLILRCRMKSKDWKKQLTYGVDASTIIDVHRRFFGWNVTLMDCDISVAHSERLCFRFSDELTFEITSVSFVDGLKVLFQLNEWKEDVSQLITFKISFQDEKHNKIVEQQDNHLFKDNEVYLFPHFVSNAMLEKSKLNSISCKFMMDFEIYVTKSKISYNEIDKFHFNTSDLCSDENIKTMESPVTNMQNAFQNLFVNRKFTDVTLKVGNEEFPTHKLVLRARSPFFENMLEHNVSENETMLMFLP